LLKWKILEIVEKGDSGNYGKGRVWKFRKEEILEKSERKVSENC
jgi:hypothetical protein